MTAYIQTHKLCKKYEKHLALDHVNLHVQKGAIYGLIGRNGAGKTTLLKILSQHIHPSQGSFEIGSANAYQNRIGAIIEAPGLYGHLTAYGNMKLKCEAMGIRRPGYIEDLLELVELAPIGKKKRVKHFSLGMKQRLGLALALVGDPDILLLDEPTNGLDPQGISDMRRILLSLNQERQITMIVSSHILDELSRLITHLGIIHQGRLVKELSKEELLDENRDRLILKSSQLSDIIPFLEDHLGLDDFQMVDQQTLEIFDHVHHAERIAHPLIKEGFLFEHLALHQHSLEDYFIHLTGGDQHD